MTRKIRISLLLLGCLVVLVLLALLLLYVAARHVPEFYREALEIPADNLKRGSDRMLQQAAAIKSAVNRPGRWETRITAEEINGWLAVDLPNNHPHALPPMLRQPRVAIDENEITVACLYEQEGVKSVLSLTVQPYLPKPNVIAMRIVHARAGMLPVPLRKVLDRITEAARDANLRLEWRRDGDDPVVMLTVPRDERSGWTAQIDSLKLGDGEIHIAGSTLEQHTE